MFKETDLTICDYKAGILNLHHSALELHRGFGCGDGDGTKDVDDIFRITWSFYVTLSDKIQVIESIQKAVLVLIELIYLSKLLSYPQSLISLLQTSPR